MAQGGKQVRQDETGIWFSATLASQKSGLTKPELARRASTGEIDYRDDLPGRHWWYREDQVYALAKAKIAADLSKVVKPKRQPTDAQIEARQTRQWKADIDRERKARVARESHGPGPGGGPIASHLERAMLREVAANNAKRKKDGSID